MTIHPRMSGVPKRRPGIGERICPVSGAPMQPDPGSGPFRLDRVAIDHDGLQRPALNARILACGIGKTYWL